MAALKSCVGYRRMIIFVLGVVARKRSQTLQSLHHLCGKCQLMSKVDVDPSSAVEEYQQAIHTKLSKQHFQMSQCGNATTPAQIISADVS